MRLSYWEQKSLIGDPDVVIIGAGIVGLTAAKCILEAHPKLKVTIMEGQAIGALASSRNAGFACFGSVSELVADIATYGEDKVLELLDLRRKGLALLIQRLRPRAINYQEVGGYEVFRTSESFKQNESHIASLNKLIGENIFEVTSIPASMRFHPKTIFNRTEGHLDTGKMYNSLYNSALDAGVRILNGIKVADYLDKGDKVFLKLERIEGDFICRRLLVTNNALAKNILPELNVVPCRNQVLITSPIPNLGLSGTFHMDEGYVYFRDVDGAILIGGGRHQFPEEEIGTLGSNQANLNYLKDLLRQFVLPEDTQYSVDSTWSGVLTGGSNRLPIVQRVSENTTVAVRLGGMGVAIGSIIGQQVATLAFQ